MSKFYVTTPIYYVNASPHVGHAYTTVIADTAARWQRLKGNQVFFLTGTDEHGEKIRKAAEAAGLDTQAFVDAVSGNFRDLWEKIDVCPDFFVRTTNGFHKKAVQEVIRSLDASGDIYKAKYTSLYCVPCESFWTATQVKDAGGVCPDCRRQVETIEEENYFFRLSKYQDWLTGYLEANPDFLRPRPRHNEVMGFLKNNKLDDLCISRPKKRVSWGVEFPLDPDYVVYVWFDALLNYISAVGYGVDALKFAKWWPADVQFMAKDILRHHAIFWPIMLKALGLPLPVVVFAHGWWKIGEEKISKSKGNIVNPLELIKDIGIDATRYFLLREVALGLDGNYSWPAVVLRVNNDLANDLGNLVYRTLNMNEKYFNAQLVRPDKSLPQAFRDSFEAVQRDFGRRMDAYEFSGALETLSGFISAKNKYVENTKPWNLNKEGRQDELKKFIYDLLEGIRICAIYLSPVMPRTSGIIYRQLGLEAGQMTLANAVWGCAAEYKTTKGQPLFPRIEDK